MSNFLGSADTMGNILSERIKYWCHRTIRETNGITYFLLPLQPHLSGWPDVLHRGLVSLLPKQRFSGTWFCKVIHSFTVFTHFCLNQREVSGFCL